MMEKKRKFFHLYFCYSTKALTVKKWDGHDGHFIFDVCSDSAVCLHIHSNLDIDNKFVIPFLFTISNNHYRL